MDDGTTKKVSFENLVQPGTSTDVDTHQLNDPFYSLSHFLDGNDKITRGLSTRVIRSTLPRGASALKSAAILTLARLTSRSPF